MVESNQTHLIITNANDLSLVNIITIMVGIVSAAGIIYSIWISRKTLKEAIKEGKDSQ
jgi:hypothetical protein